MTIHIDACPSCGQEFNRWQTRWMHPPVIDPGLPGVPPDIGAQLELHPDGICGVCSIAAISDMTVTEMMEVWEEVHGEPYHGHSTVSDLVRALTHLDIGVRMRRGRPLGYRIPSLAPEERAFAKLQFANPDDPDGRWHHHMDAMRNIHFVALAGGRDGETYILCNMQQPRGRWYQVGGWQFDPEWYLRDGTKITSHYIIGNGRAGTCGS